MNDWQRKMLEWYDQQVKRGLSPFVLVPRVWSRPMVMNHQVDGRLDEETADVVDAEHEPGH